MFSKMALKVMFVSNKVIEQKQKNRDISPGFLITLHTFL